MKNWIDQEKFKDAVVEATTITILDAWRIHEERQQKLIRDLSRIAAERGALLREILEECNDAHANGGYSRLKEETLKKIEKVLEE